MLYIKTISVLLKQNICTYKHFKLTDDSSSCTSFIYEKYKYTIKRSNHTFQEAVKNCGNFNSSLATYNSNLIDFVKDKVLKKNKNCGLDIRKLMMVKPKIVNSEKCFIYISFWFKKTIKFEKCNYAGTSTYFCQHKQSIKENIEIINTTNRSKTTTVKQIISTTKEYKHKKKNRKNKDSRSKSDENKNKDVLNGKDNKKKEKESWFLSIVMSCLGTIIFSLAIFTCYSLIKVSY